MTAISFFRTTFVNFSIDVHDYANPLDQTWHINEIESVVEFVCEEVLEMGDILPESDDDNKARGKSSMTFIVMPPLQHFSLPEIMNREHLLLFTAGLFRSLKPSINTPPPR